MKGKGVFIMLIISFMTGSILLDSCVHDPLGVSDQDDPPRDTTDNPMDTTSNDNICDPDTVYFLNDVLPILQSNCAVSGCHDNQTAEDGVRLTNYNDVINTADVEAFDLNGSDLYERITDDDEDDRMPPAPRNRLTVDQINTIAKWILQGAQNLECDPNAGGCDSENITFSGFVNPLITNSCKGCHSGISPEGGISLENYQNIKQVAENGRLYGAISWQSAYTNMPFNQEMLDDCTIEKVKSWIDDGAQNN